MDVRVVAFAVCITVVLVIQRLLTLRERHRDRRREADRRRQLFEEAFRNRFGFEPPRNPAQRERWEPLVMQKVEAAGELHHRIPELVGERARSASPHMGKVVVFPGLLGCGTAVTTSLYREMRGLALQAGYPKEPLDEVEARIQQKARQLSAA
ncbi:MAG TPA: hypothetical protein VGN15_06145 [Ktedonobacteraceae bacterium]|nr:hypothetical protein [Ktedonobacteraceae bacterium]